MAEMDKGKGNSNLLRYLSGEISFEEWTAAQQTEQENTVIKPLAEEEDLSFGDLSVESEVEVASSTQVFSAPEVGHLSSMTESESEQRDLKAKGKRTTPGKKFVPPTLPITAGQDTTGHPASAVLGMPGKVDTETMLKYLTGQMSFLQFEEILEREMQITATGTAADKKSTEDKQDENEEAGEPPASIEEEETTAEGEKQLLTQPSHSGESDGPTGSRRGRKKDSARSKLPKDLQGLMGEANLKFARGEVEEAIKMCMEIIRLVPKANEPFQTLSMIYEDQGDEEKSLQYAMIAAYLKPKDWREWARLAEIHVERNSLHQGILCYSNAIKANRTNIDFWEKRCELYEQKGETKKAVEGYFQILQLLPDDQPDVYIQKAKDLATKLHDMSDLKNAVMVMETMLNKHPTSISVEEVHLTLELQILSGAEYTKLIEVIVRFCDVSLETKDGTEISCPDVTKEFHLPEKMPDLSKCVVPKTLPVDIRVKLIVALIYLSYLDIAESLEQDLFAEDPNEVGDLFLDIADAYKEKGHYSKARPILGELIHCEKYNMAAVWLKYSECLNALGEIQLAAKAYKQVVKMAPSHHGARLSLSALQQQLGHHEDALRTLQTEGETKTGGQDSPPEDVRLLVPRCYLLYSQRKFPKFVECAKKLLFGDVKLNLKTSKYLGQANTARHRMVGLKCAANKRMFETIKRAADLQNEASLATDDLFDIYVKAVETLLNMKDYQEAEGVALMGLACERFFADPKKAQHVDFICLATLILAKNGETAYNFMRCYVLKDIHNNMTWNLFNQVVCMMTSLRHNRFCLRLSTSHPNHQAMAMLNGHSALLSGTYKHALAEYISAFQKEPDDPLLSLLIGVSFIHIACQKFTTRRHSIIVQACAFLNKYLEQRGPCQESYYNLGRAMHQLGLTYAAVFYYQKALELPSTVQGELSDLYDLRREIAYNLCLIYENSGSEDLAAYIRQEHLVI